MKLALILGRLQLKGLFCTMSPFRLRKLLGLLKYLQLVAGLLNRCQSFCLNQAQDLFAGQVELFLL